MRRKIVADKYEIVAIRSRYACGLHYNFGLKRQAYAPDRYYAWISRHSDPERQWTQMSVETEAEFIDRVQQDICRVGSLWTLYRQG